MEIPENPLFENYRVEMNQEELMNVIDVFDSETNEFQSPNFSFGQEKNTSKRIAPKYEKKESKLHPGTGYKFTDIISLDHCSNLYESQSH